MAKAERLWGLRPGEMYQLVRLDDSCELAVKLCDTSGLPEPANSECANLLLVGATRNQDGEWQWQQLGPTSKEEIANTMLISGLEIGVWYGVTIWKRDQWWLAYGQSSDAARDMGEPSDD